MSAINDAWEDLCDLLDLARHPIALARAQAYWTVWGAHTWWHAMRSPSKWCRSQAVSMAAVIAIHAALLAWGAAADPPTWMLVMGALVIMTGWTAIAVATAGRMVGHPKK